MLMLDGSNRPIYGWFLRLAPVLILIFIIAGCITCLAQEVEKMHTNYVQLVVVNDDGVVSKATGIALTSDTVLSVFHILEPGVRVATPDGTTTKEGHKNAKIGEIIEVDPYNDWCVIRFPEPMFKPAKLRFAKAISVGEPVFSVTNMFGRGPIFLISHVAKLEHKKLYVNPSMGRGSSGSAMYIQDERGRPIFIGMYQGEIAIEDSPTSIGYGLRAVHLKDVVRKYTLPKPSVVPFPDASETNPP